MHRLALGLGCMVCEIDARMPSSELTSWLAYYKLDPFGAERDNWHAAQIAAILVNANLRKGSAPANPADFMYVDQVTTRRAKAATFHSELKKRAKRKG